MLIDTTLLANDQALIDGLADGRLRRFGGVIRDNTNGRIVKHLLEAPETSEELVETPLNSLLGRSGGFARRVGQRVVIPYAGAVQDTLSAILQVSQIGAVASVINLGVSAVGFAYMGYKLNQLQQAMSAMQERLSVGLDRVDSKLSKLTKQLDYLLVLAETNRYEQQRLGEAIAELHRALLVRELAEMQAWLDQLSRFPDDSRKEALLVASKARRVLADQALRATPELEPRVMLIADISIRGWAASTAMEANLLMELGQHRAARQLIEGEQPRFARLSERWAEALLTDQRPQLQTAYRFNAPRFQDHIQPERVERIARLHSPDRLLSADRRRLAADEAELELGLSYNAHLDERWTSQQLAVAEYLDGLSELSSRLEAIGSFAQECDIRKLSSSREALPERGTPPGIYVLPALSG